MINFFIIAGEISADNHGSVLMKEIKKLQPNVKFTGIGGPNMIKEGMQSIEKIDNLAIMGFVEVIRHLYFFNNLINRVLKEINLIKPKQIILIDYPGFNLHLAKKIKKKYNIPITYYISPQLWAWKEGRVKIIKNYIAQMLVIFPFEKKWYEEKGYKVKFVGHPFFDQWDKSSKIELCNYFNLNIKKPIITLFPGSRNQEVNRHLPLLIEVAHKIRETNENIQFLLGVANKISLKKFTIPHWIKVEYKFPQKALECATLGLVASGSATFEGAMYGVPMLIIYKMSALSWLISKFFVKTKYAGIINILADKKIIPEYLQNEATLSLISNKALKIISDDKKLLKMKKEMNLIKNMFKNKKASKNAAKHIVALVKKNE